MTRAREESAEWRNIYKGPIPVSSLADRLGYYISMYTMYSSVRPFGITAIIGGVDSEEEAPVDGQVGSGPNRGAGGKVEGLRTGGPGLYMVEPSGLYWVRLLPHCLNLSSSPPQDSSFTLSQASNRNTT